MEENTNTNETTPDTKLDKALEEAEKVLAPKPRGFAAMDRSKVKEIASKGGKSAHAAGTAHQFTSEEARIAGKKGGTAPHVSRGGVRKTRTGGDAILPSDVKDGKVTATEA